MSNTINDWKPETQSLLETLQKHNVTILSVDNGEGSIDLANTTWDNFIEETMACDEAHLFVRTPDGKRRTMYLVYGNDPGELVCDYSIAEEIDAAVDEHYTKWENVKQPTKKA